MAIPRRRLPTANESVAYIPAAARARGARAMAQSSPPRARRSPSQSSTSTPGQAHLQHRLARLDLLQGRPAPSASGPQDRPGCAGRSSAGSGRGRTRSSPRGRRRRGSTPGRGPGSAPRRPPRSPPSHARRWSDPPSPPPPTGSPSRRARCRRRGRRTCLAWINGLSFVAPEWADHHSARRAPERDLRERVESRRRLAGSTPPWGAGADAPGGGARLSALRLEVEPAGVLLGE
jgi:hypothetical protein